jgi:hypothetical protein
MWLPRSPDLASPNFYIWGYLKEVVYSTNTHIMEELNSNTEEDIKGNISYAT